MPWPIDQLIHFLVLLCVWSEFKVYCQPTVRWVRSILLLNPFKHPINFLYFWMRPSELTLFLFKLYFGQLEFFVGNGLPWWFIFLLAFLQLFTLNLKDKSDEEVERLIELAML